MKESPFQHRFVYNNSVYFFCSVIWRKCQEQWKETTVADVIMIKGNECRLFDWILRLKAVRHCKCNYLSFFISMHSANLNWKYIFYLKNHCMCTQGENVRRIYRSAIPTDVLIVGPINGEFQHRSFGTKKQIFILYLPPFQHQKLRYP